MDSIRFILLALGVVLIGGIYLYHRISTNTPEKGNTMFHYFIRWFSSLNKKKAKADKSDSSTLLYDEPDDADIAALSGLTPSQTSPEVDSSSIGPLNALQNEEQIASGDSLVIVLNIMAKQDELFNGEAVSDVLSDQGFEFGAMNIYHYYPDSSSKEVLCSIANSIEPGTLEPERLAITNTPGLSLFMQLPGPVEGREAFERVLSLGRGIVESLNGVLCDEKRSVLTMQTIGHMKEKIEAFRFKQKMASIQQNRH